MGHVQDCGNTVLPWPCNRITHNRTVYPLYGVRRCRRTENLWFSLAVPQSRLPVMRDSTLFLGTMWRIGSLQFRDSLPPYSYTVFIYHVPFMKIVVCFPNTYSILVYSVRDPRVTAIQHITLLFQLIALSYIQHNNGQQWGRTATSWNICGGRICLAILRLLISPNCTTKHVIQCVLCHRREIQAASNQPLSYPLVLWYLVYNTFYKVYTLSTVNWYIAW